jgi:hypothetical protein
VLLAIEMISEWSLTIISMLENFDLLESEMFVEMAEAASMSNSFLKVL